MIQLTIYRTFSADKTAPSIFSVEFESEFNFLIASGEKNGRQPAVPGESNDDDGMLAWLPG